MPKFKGRYDPAMHVSMFKQQQSPKKHESPQKNVPRFQNEKESYMPDDLNLLATPKRIRGDKQQQ